MMWGWCQVSNISAARGIIQLHTDSYSGTCENPPAINNIKVHDCLIHDVIGQAILLDGGVGNVSLYNNLIYNSPTEVTPYSDIFALRGGGGNMNVKIYGNTVYSNPGYTNSGEILGFGPGSGSVAPNYVELYNNYFCSH